jgi:hypothetical protein
MNPDEIRDPATILKSFTTQRLEDLLPALLKELRARDSKHIKEDAITTSRALRMLRGTVPLPRTKS